MTGISGTTITRINGIDTHKQNLYQAAKFTGDKLGKGLVPLLHHRPEMVDAVVDMIL